MDRDREIDVAERGAAAITRMHLPVWRRLAWRLGASFPLLTALGILLSGLLQYRAQDRWLRPSLGSLLLNIARTGALLLAADQHQAVVAAGRNDTPAYEAIRAQLERIQKTNRPNDPVYTLSDIQGDMARFAVISHGREPVGKQYRLAPEIRPILHRVLAQGVPAYTGIYFNEHGTWMTAFAPVPNAADKPVAVLVRALEAHSGEPGSLRRLGGAALALADGLELSPGQREALELGALLHDIGEIRTPEAVLQKPGALTPDERRIVERHPAQGGEILETVPLLTPALDVVGAHHERYDGGGSPHGLRGDEIPLTARIFAVVDAHDAMTHDRPYRRAHALRRHWISCARRGETSSTPGWRKPHRPSRRSGGRSSSGVAGRPPEIGRRWGAAPAGT